ncbi:hypothetical protein [Streptomyces sp. FH025]|uniref:hypothetical protein n=1 Tax=Streptomyces sp. FH025 TaxID=2815937 RepID=UPI001A9F9880|nr:hypothetical protein [Streptomyces sp. FH025]MBO1417822.1 hypothetical protein [Streptomyces sp. FH025]
MNDRPMGELPSAPYVIDDTLFGEITVRIEGQERVIVSGENIPTAVLERDPGCEVDPHIAIGTRDATHLTLTIDGTPSRLRPGKGKLLRQTYRVSAEYDGAVYVLLPDSIPSSRLTRDGTRLGDFSSDGDEIVIAEWKDGVPTRPADAAIGYVLSSAFGTGGQPTWMLFAEAVSAVLP